MEYHAPAYYPAFRCLAGDCPHTCCAGWEIPIDPATAALYRSLPGPLGRELRDNLAEDDEGEAYFQLKGRYCPFLDEKKLCRIHLRLGREATCAICRSHPRFSYDYGSLREEGLCASCPEAARLVLEEDGTLETSQLPDPAGETPPLLSPLLSARETAFALLKKEAPIGRRLQALLLFANEVQVLLDQERADDLPRLCAIYREEFPLVDPQVLPPAGQALDRCLAELEGLEILQPAWRDLLSRGRRALSAQAVLPPPPPLQGARVAAYFLYRHWLRGVWDADVLSWAELTVLGVVVSAWLAPLQPEGFPEAFRLFCLEIEHSNHNLSALQDAFWDRLSLPELLALAGG